MLIPHIADNKKLNSKQKSGIDIAFWTWILKAKVTDVLDLPWLKDWNLPSDLVAALKIFAKYNLDWAIVSNQIFNLWLNHLHKMVLDKVTHSQPLTNWQEWEIYVISDNEWNEFLVAKKRYHIWWEKEFENHKIAFDLSNKIDCWVKIPLPVDFFIDWEDEYIIMEYIHWRTLYTLIWEEITNDFLIPKVNQFLSEKLWWNYSSHLLDFISTYWSNGRVVYSNDNDCINWMRDICSLLNEIWILSAGFGAFNHIDPTNPDSPKEYFIEKKLLIDYLSKISLFTSDEKRTITSKLHIFLSKMHELWLYHNDLWKNFRNIMFDWCDPYIIDFWKSDFNNSSSSLLWNYSIDTDIINVINSTKDKKNTEKQVDYSRIISNWKSIWLVILDNDLQISVKLKWTINLKKVLNDFIHGQNLSIYNWLIHKNPKWDYKIKSTELWKKRLFSLISLLSEEEKEELLSIINLMLAENQKTNTRKYFYSTLFKKYIEASYW